MLRVALTARGRGWGWRHESADLVMDARTRGEYAEVADVMRARWRDELLAEAFVAMSKHEGLSRETVRCTLRSARPARIPARSVLCRL